MNRSSLIFSETTTTEEDEYETLPKLYMYMTRARGFPPPKIEARSKYEEVVVVVDDE
jgi:hypothetical protein